MACLTSQAVSQVRCGYCKPWTRSAPKHHRAAIPRRKPHAVHALQVVSDHGSSSVLEEEASFMSRLHRAWNIMFPPKQQRQSPSQVAKTRLKMILISDRCSVNDEAKRKIVDNIVGALADFVEIEREDKVELNVSAKLDVGTVYYVTVPVRRVRPEYQEFSHGDFELEVGRASAMVQEALHAEET